MANSLPVVLHLPYEEVLRRFKACTDPLEQLRWQAILFRMEGKNTGEVAALCHKGRHWVTNTVRTYNLHGPEALHDHRRENGRSCLLSPEEQTELRQALTQPPATGGSWTSADVAAWIAPRVHRTVTAKCGGDYLKRLKWSRQRPRPRHPKADAADQDTFKKNSAGGDGSGTKGPSHSDRGVLGGR